MICVHDFVGNLFRTLSRTFLVHCNGLNSIRSTQTGLPRSCHGLCRKHLDILRWFVFTTFMICVHNFPRREVSVNVSVMKFGLNPGCSHTMVSFLPLFCLHCSGSVLNVSSSYLHRVQQFDTPTEKLVKNH